MALSFFINVVRSKFENVKQMALKDLTVLSAAGPRPLADVLHLDLRILSGVKYYLILLSS